MACFQVEETVQLPRGVCSNCTKMALAAMHFRKVCLESAKQWARATTQLVRTAPRLGDRSLFIFYDHDKYSILGERKEIATVTLAMNRLNERIRLTIPVRSTAKLKSRKGVRWRCRDCGKEFTLPCYLNQHLKMTRKRACTHCGLVIGREKLHQHLARHHNIHLFPCKICHQLFHCQKDLENHKKTAHGSQSHACRVCGHGFVSERALRAHRYAHSLFHCTACNSSYENRRCYKYHVSRCKGSKLPPNAAFECHDCGNRYTKKESLRTHMEQKHLNVLPFVCQECGKRSSTLGHHRAHEAIHMPKRKVYKCYCGAKLLTELGFSLHTRIHSGEKPYECAECGDKFLSSSRRLDHMKRRHAHLGEMPHPCKHCSAKFMRPSQLKKHCLATHGISI